MILVVPFTLLDVSSLRGAGVGENAGQGGGGGIPSPALDAAKKTSAGGVGVLSKDEAPEDAATEMVMKGFSRHWPQQIQKMELLEAGGVCVGGMDWECDAQRWSWSMRISSLGHLEEYGDWEMARTG